MKDPLDVLRSKEQELLRVKTEIEALRITVRLLGEDNPASTHPAANAPLSQRVELRRVVEMP
jgi:hypothetical protein